MQFALKLKGSIYNLMRQAGYHPEGRDEKTGEPVFIRRLGASDYPRFHAYVSRGNSGKIITSLHLDQKKPIYKGAPAHAAEYEGEVVEREVERIKNISGR